MAEHIIRLLKLERLDAYLASSYTDAASAWSAIGNAWKAKEWAEEVIAMGLVSDGLRWAPLEGLRVLRENPEEH